MLTRVWVRVFMLYITLCIFFIMYILCFYFVCKRMDLIVNCVVLH